jgi:hypothetical protein
MGGCDEDGKYYSFGDDGDDQGKKRARKSSGGHSIGGDVDTTLLPLLRTKL